MTIGLLFWILMLLWLILIIVPHWGVWGWGFGGGLLGWIIIALLGWKVFGPMIHG